MYAALQLGGKTQFLLSQQKNIYFTINATIGALYGTSPELKGASITDTSTATITQSNNSGFGFIYSLGCGVHYQLNDKFFLTATVNYIGTNKITFKNIKTTLTTTKGIYGTPEYSIQQSTTTANGKQTISSIGLLFGFGISF